MARVVAVIAIKVSTVHDMHLFVPKSLYSHSYLLKIGSVVPRQLGPDAFRFRPYTRISNIDYRAMEAGLPIRVSLVAFGHNQDLHLKALDRFEGDAWRKLDVRNYPSRDPAAGGVGHQENGSTPTTQICVFSMPEFVELAVNEYRKIIEERKFARLYGCNRGMHRSDVLVRWLEHALNALKTIDGRHVFEARASALAEGYGTKGPFNIGGERHLVDD